MAARIRLKVTGKAKRQLLQILRKRRVVLKVSVSVSAASGGPAKAYTRKAAVKRPQRRRR